MNRWRPLVNWLLIIPYAIIAYIVYHLGRMVFFAFFITILFAKTSPEGMFNIVQISLRWLARASAYKNWMVTRVPTVRPGLIGI